MSIKTPDDSAAPERFTAKECDLIRREFMVWWGWFRPLSEGPLVFRWAGGPRKGTPKIGPTIQGMLDRGLVEIDDPELGMPSARFTPAGIAALQAMARNALVLSPKEYGHVLDQLEDLVGCRTNFDRFRELKDHRSLEDSTFRSNSRTYALTSIT
jgi:hypothetical protein